MANDVVLGAAMRSNLLSLQNTQRSIDNTQLRLATGKKVNSALDNPQSFFQAQSLNNRASDLTRLLDGIGQSIRTIEEADKGITALTTLVTQAQSVAEEALSEIRASQGLATARGSKDLSDITDLQESGVITNTTNAFQVSFIDEDGNVGDADITIAAGDTVYDIVAAINGDTDVNEDIKAKVNSAGQLEITSLTENGFIRVRGAAANSLTAGGFAELGLDTFVRTEFTGADAAATRLGATAVAGNVIRSAEAADNANTNVDGVYLASATLTQAGFAAADADDFTITLTIDGSSDTTATLTGASTIQELVDEINTSDLAEKVTASYNTETGRIEFSFADGVSDVTLAIDDIAGGVTPAFGFGSGGTDVAIDAADSVSEAFVLVGTSPDLTQYQKDYNKLRDQIDGIVEDANYRGVNLLQGDNLTTFFNEDRSNTLVSEGADFTALGLGLEEADFTKDSGVQAAIDATRNALDQVRNFGSSIANDLAIIQTRRDFTEQTINTLKAGASDLTDADLNEEGANLLALQTAQQLGVTSLSLASQSQQSVLRLF